MNNYKDHPSCLKTKKQRRNREIEETSNTKHFPLDYHTLIYSKKHIQTGRPNMASVGIQLLKKPAYLRRHSSHYRRGGLRRLKG